MSGRIWRVLHPLLTLLAVGCCAWLVWRDSKRPDPARHSAQADIPLRQLIGAKSIGGDYKLPAGEDHCAVVVLEFVDGKFAARRGGIPFSPKPGESRVVPYTVMWCKHLDGKTRVTTGGWGGWGTHDDDTFFAKLDGGRSQLQGPMKSEESIHGYRVIGYAVSSKMRDGQECFASQLGGLNFALEHNHAVAVLGLKTFPTADEAKDWLYNSHEPRDPRAKWFRA